MVKQRITPPDELAAFREAQRKKSTGRRSYSSGSKLRISDDVLPHVRRCACYIGWDGDEYTDGRCASLRLRSLGA